MLAMYSSSIGSFEKIVKNKPNKKLKNEQVNINTFKRCCELAFTNSICVDTQMNKPTVNKIHPIFLNRLGNKNEVFIM
jgi:hypothetical protein